jgi:hypothetical protein
MDSALFVSQKMGIKTDWTPIILNNSEQFSDEIKVHASKNNKLSWQT